MAAVGVTVQRPLPVSGNRRNPRVKTRRKNRLNLRTFETLCPRGNECGSFTRVNGSLRFLGITHTRGDALGISLGANHGPRVI